MNQSTIIFGYLAAAFLIFIVQRGELPTYWGFLVSSPAQPPSGPNAAQLSATTPITTISSAADVSTLVDAAAAFA